MYPTEEIRKLKVDAGLLLAVVETDDGLAQGGGLFHSNK
jgi:hypothetical protein